LLTQSHSFPTRRSSDLEILIIASSSQPFVSESGLTFKPQRTFKTAPSLDTLIIPGGSGIRKPVINRSVSAFVKARAGSTRRIARSEEHTSELQSLRHLV